MTFGDGDWTQLILEAVENIADREYQERSWFDRPWLGSPRGYREISSPGEDINRLFSDLDFEDFLASPKVELTAEQYHSGIVLRDSMNGFIQETPEFLDPEQVIDDPRWVGIRKAAAAFANVLRVGRTA